MDAPRTAVLTLLGLILLLGRPAPAQEAEAIREVTVKEILAACKGANAAKIWRQADLLTKMGNPAKRYIRANI